MTTLVAVNLMLLLLAVLVGLLERTHRHEAGVPHAPLGGDLLRDADLQRTLHDLDVHR